MFFAYIDSVDKTLLLGLPRKQDGYPIGCLRYFRSYLGQNVDFGSYERLPFVYWRGESLLDR